MSIEYSIIIPCYNEGKVIVEVIDELKKYLDEHLRGDYEILVVDDGSTDDTAQNLARIEGIRVIHHRANRGYGASIKTGILSARGSYVASYDGDGQHYPGDLVRLLQKVKSEDLALGVGARSKTFHSNLWRMPGKWVLGWLANYLTRTKIPDLNSGLRVFKKDLVTRYLHLCSDRFSFSTTSTLIFLNRGYPMAFMPIEVRKRVGKSTVSLMTGYETVLLILRTVCLFDPLRIFIPGAAVLVAAGILLGIYPYFILKRGLSTGSVLVLLSGVLVFFFGLLADQISSLRKEKYE